MVTGLFHAQRKRLQADLVDDDVIALPLSQPAGGTKTVGSAGRSEREAQRYQNGLKDRASLTSAICTHAREKPSLKPMTNGQAPKVDPTSAPKFKALISFEL